VKVKLPASAAFLVTASDGIRIGARPCGDSPGLCCELMREAAHVVLWHALKVG
jgi:hypothetical protein